MQIEKILQEEYDKMFPCQLGGPVGASSGLAMKDIYEGKPVYSKEQLAVIDYIDRVQKRLKK